jgi:hypothetical protein
MYEQFASNITFQDGRYEVSLPWRNPLAAISLNYQLSLKRLRSLLRRLRQNRNLLVEYNRIMHDQLKEDIIEIVEDAQSAETERIHYLPHHAVIRYDKDTTKLRIVYDASAKSEGLSLNDCLYVGPKFNQKIIEILLRFRVHPIVLTSDIEKPSSMCQYRKEIEMCCGFCG